MAAAKKGDPPKKGEPSKRGAKKRLPVADPPKKEVDDDALMTATLRAMEWANKRKRQIAYAAGATVAAVLAFIGWTFYRTNREEKASELLSAGVAAELSPIKDGTEDPEVMKRVTFYASEDEKLKAALSSFATAKAKYGDTGVGILARLGEAGVFLERRDWDSALAAYTDVRNTALAAADSNVRMRCIEGVGYAREGKGLLDDARRSFEELMKVDSRGAKPLGLYHLARIDVAKGDKAGAIDKLKAAREAITAPNAPSAHYLKDVVDKLLGGLDPTAIPKSPPGQPPMPGMPGMPGGGKYTKEQIEQLMKQIGGSGGAMPPMPPAPPASGKP